MIALSTQIHIDPGLRAHDAETRERLVELFGAPERWAATTTSIVWARVESLLPSFTGATEFTLPVPCTYDLEVAAAKYLDALPDGEVPLSFHFTGTHLLPRRRRAPADRAGALERRRTTACRSRSGGA